MSDYNIFEPQALDDLVVVGEACSATWGAGLWKAHDLWTNDVVQLLQVTRATEGREEKYDVERPDRAILHLQLRAAPHLIAFAYLSANGLELHIPEAYLFSRFDDLDVIRTKQVMEWLRIVEKGGAIQWRTAEWPGGQAAWIEGRPQEVLAAHRADTEDRIDIERGK